MCYGTWTLLTAAGFFTPLDWVLSIAVAAIIVGYFATKTRGRLAQMQKRRTMRSIDRHVSLLFRMRERDVNRTLAGSGVSSGTEILLLE